MKKYARDLDLSVNLRSTSCFLFGPRATGKTSLLKTQLKDAVYVDLLNADTYDELTRRPLSLQTIDKKLSYWRSGKYEVDLIVGKEIAIEIKFSKQMKTEFYTNLQALKEEGLIKKFLIVGRFLSEGQRDGIRYVPYEVFIKTLWRGEII